MKKYNASTKRDRIVWFFSITAWLAHPLIFLISMCGDAVTENGERYRKKINYLFLHQLQDICDNDDYVDNKLQLYNV